MLSWKRLKRPLNGYLLFGLSVYIVSEASSWLVNIVYSRHIHCAWVSFYGWSCSLGHFYYHYYHHHYSSHKHHHCQPQQPVYLRKAFSRHAVKLCCRCTVDDGLGTIRRRLHQKPHERRKRQADKRTLFERHVSVDVSTNHARAHRIHRHLRLFTTTTAARKHSSTSNLHTELHR